jgi:cyclophilin family peptidyl-prolyl cis-trans isomerase
MDKYSSIENPRVYFEVEINHKDAGTVVFELFKNVVPRTAENFRQLCTGEAGRSKVSGRLLTFSGCGFHRVIKGFMA